MDRQVRQEICQLVSTKIFLGLCCIIATFRVAIAQKYVEVSTKTIATAIIFYDRGTIGRIGKTV